MYMSDEQILVAASNLVAALSARFAFDQDGIAKETVKMFKKLKEELGKEPS